MSVPFLYINNVLNLILKGRAIQVSPSHPSYGLIKQSLEKASENELLDLINVEKSMTNFVTKESKGRATVSSGQVYFDGKPVHSTIANRVLSFMKDGLPFQHLLKFMENVALNPSFRAQEELFDFLENKFLPITLDGCFLAYKAINKNWFDKYSGTIDNSIGNIIEVPRNSVDDERTHECSKGLHCGALEYVYSYGSGDDHIIIVKVNPKDVVSVPKDYNFQKLRCCKYEVVHEFQGEMGGPLYTDKAEKVPSPINDDKYDWGWADRHNIDGYYDDDNYDEDEEIDDDYDYDEDWGDDSDLDDLGEQGDDSDTDEDEDEDCLSAKDVCVTKPQKCSSDDVGIKPNGQIYHNRRDRSGRFCK